VKYYAIKEIAILLNILENQAFDLTNGGNYDAGKIKNILYPSIELVKPVFVQRILCKDHLVFDVVDEELKPGYYDASSNNSDLLIWDESGYAYVDKVDGATVKSPLKIPKSAIRISKEHV
jgi:hypothetical protein